MTKNQLIAALVGFSTQLKDDAERSAGYPPSQELMRQTAARLDALIVQAQLPRAIHE